MILYVGNIGMSTTERELNHLFAGYGPVTQMSLVKGDVGAAHCFAFIGISEDEQARKAIADINGTKLAGNALIVKEAKPRKTTQTQSFRQRGRPIRYKRS
jgi:RNA recognition motif-containing protein